MSGSYGAYGAYSPSGAVPEKLHISVRINPHELPNMTDAVGNMTSSTVENGWCWQILQTMNLGLW